MTPQEAANRFEQLRRLFEEQIPELIRINGITLATKVKERITLKGLDKNNSKFPAYSAKYDAYKTKKGKNAGFRNFVFSGSMMQNFKVFKEGNEYMMGFPDDKAETIAEGNSYGNGKWNGVGENIIEPTQKEVEELTEDFNKSLDKLIKQIFA